MQPAIGSIWELPKIESGTAPLPECKRIVLPQQPASADSLEAPIKFRPSRRFKVHGFTNCGCVACREMGEENDLKAGAVFHIEDFGTRLTEVRNAPPTAH